MRVLFSFFAIPVLALAQPGLQQGTLELSLARAVDIALEPEGSARVALAQQSIRRAETQVDQARGAFFPNLDGTLQDRNQTVNLRTFGFDFRVPGFAVPGLVGPFSVFDARASAQQPVLSFTNIRRYKASKAGLEATRADLDVTRNDVADQVARAYLTSLRADASLETARANVQLSEDLLKLARSQREAGSGTGIEVTRAQVQLANNQQQLSVAENDRRRAVLQLLRAMGLELSAEVRLTDRLAFEPVNTDALEASLQAARQTRAELKAQQRHEDAARLNYSTVQSERLPSLSAFGDYGAIGRHGSTILPTRMVGITLELPLFDGGRRKARSEESLTQYRQEQIRSRDLEQQVELEVRLALDSLRSAATQVTTAEEGLRLAQDEVAQAQRRYQAGVSVPLEVTDAQTRLDRARENQTAALYNYNLARLELAAATGTIQEFTHR
jgi:outer membrane protein